MRKITLLLLLASCELAPEPVTLPEMEAVLASEITMNGAKLHSSVKTVGNQEILEYGFVYSENQGEEEGVRTKHGAIDMKRPSPIPFLDNISALKLNTSYYVRSYASTAQGTVYSQEMSFKTLNIVQPGVRTEGSESVSHLSAKLKGTLTSKGTYPITQYGMVWSKDPAPTTALSTKMVSTAAVYTFPAPYQAEASGLSPNTKYYFRAFVVANSVTTYGAEMSFTTTAVVQPGIRTDAASGLTVNSARLAGTLTSKGSYPISEYGLVWSTLENPTTAQNKVFQSGDVATFPRNYILSAGGLQANTAYFYRAYVISNGVTTYGSQLSFRTAAVAPPSLSTGGADGITVNSVRLSGTLSAGGSYPITEYGVCWGTSPGPTPSGMKASESDNPSAFPRNFSFSVGSLNPNTAYYYRAYAISNGVLYYGSELSFRTASVSQPKVSTGGNGGITVNSARLSGSLNSKGSYPISEYGVCWSTGSSPTVSGSKVAEYSDVNSFPRDFTYSATGLNPATTYYYRAYVISNGTVTYGSVNSFRTADPTPPEVVTVGAERGVVFKFLGRITAGGTFGVNEYGIVVSTNKREPTTGDTRLRGSGTPGAYPFDYTLNMNNPVPNAIYYYRAYVISNGVTYYGAAQIISNGKD